MRSMKSSCDVYIHDASNLFDVRPACVVELSVARFARTKDQTAHGTWPRKHSVYGQWRRREKRTRSRQRRRGCCCKPPPSLGRCRCPAKNEAWCKREANGAGTLIHALALARLVKPSPLAGRAVAFVVFRQRGGAQQAQHADWRLRESDRLRDECPSGAGRRYL